MTTLIPKFRQNASGAVNRPINLKLAETVSITDFGAVGNGTTDDTAAIQAAINSGADQIYVPATNNGYRTTAPITITTGITIIGDGTNPYGSAGPFGTRGRGSWFFLDHSGVGFLTKSGSSAFISTVRFEKIGTYRKHTNAITTGWTPTVFDFDFDTYNADVFYTDVVLLNPYKGINHNDGDAGRVTIDNVRGQFLFIGININKALDTVRINNFHNWPFWQNDSNVTAYTQSNAIAISLNRCDNPMLSNVFSIYTNITLGFYQNASGHTSKLHGVNLDFDISNYAIFVDSTVDGATAQFSNLTSYGPPANSSNYNIRMLGANCLFDFSNLEGQNLSRGLINVGGTGNTVTMGNVRVNSWDTLTGSNALVTVGTGNKVHIANPMAIVGSGTQFNATGELFYQYTTIGAGIITAAATTVVVNHNLPITPTLNQIKLSMETGTGAAVAVWPSNITSTQFTINCGTAPGADITVGWRASLEA
jgi:hypothetical protein